MSCVAGSVAVAVLLTWLTLIDVSAVVFGYPPLLMAAMALATLAGALAVATGLLAGLRWARRVWPIGQQVASPALAVMGLLCAVRLLDWKLIPR